MNIFRCQIIKLKLVKMRKEKNYLGVAVVCAIGFVIALTYKETTTIQTQSTVENWFQKLIKNIVPNEKI